MREQKEEKSRDFRENIRVISQIQATRGRDAEHFIKIFRHEGDNVASATLGTLLGVFEIDDSSEDSKYIVNFLFSVAKNEYFCNPRRGATASFEAALHKINVALAEIVKHGNIRWLGKFHGTIAILEKNAIHLSAAGDGRIYLSRHDSLSHISEGLSSPEAVDRPIKTFVEISSGQLMPGDRLLFLLPKAVEIITEPVLARHAGQMNRERLSQFLRTAMINQLDRGGAIVVDIEEAPVAPKPAPATRKKIAEKKDSPQNYFSETAFEKKRDMSIATALKEEHGHALPVIDPEYTDTKTGHIYIQGNKREVPHEPSRIAQYSESFLYFTQKGAQAGWKKCLQLSRAVSLKIKFLWFATLSRTQGTFTVLAHSSRSLAQKTQSQAKKSLQRSEPTSSPTFTFPSQKTATLHSALGAVLERAASHIPSATPLKKHHDVWAHKTQSLCQSAWALIQTGSHSLLLFLRAFALFLLQKTIGFLSLTSALLQKLFWSLSVRGRLIVLGLSLLAIGLLTWSLFQTGPSETLPSEEALSSSETRSLDSHALQNPEAGALALPTTEMLLTHPHSPAVASAYLNDTAVVVTETHIEIPAKGLSVPLPAGSGIPQMIAPMHDLDLLFFLTEKGVLMTFSPVNQAFTENTLPADTGSLRQLATYLTYLYTLDAEGTTLTRYPRAPGGFSAGTPWLKQNLSRDTHATFTLNESVFLFSQSTLTRYEKGKATLVFDAPSVIPEELLLATEAANPLLIGLDRGHQRLIIWNADGKVSQEYSKEILGEVVSLSLHAKSVLLSTPSETFEISLP